MEGEFPGPVGAEGTAKAIERALELHRRGASRDALELLKATQAVSPNCPVLEASLASIAAALGDPISAEAHYRRSLALDPDSAEVWNNLGNVLAGTGRNTVAETAYRQALGIQPDYANAHCNLGTLLLEQRRLPEASAEFQAAILARPGFANAYCNLAAVLLELNQFEAAESACRRAIEFEPGHVAALTNLGLALTHVERWAEAECAYRSALAIRPTDVHTLVNLGILKTTLKCIDEADALFAQAATQGASSAIFLLGLGNLRWQQARLTDAEECFRATARIHPTDWIAHNNLGGVLMELGHLQEAEVAFREACRLGPLQSEVWSNLGFALAEQKKFSEAELTYRQALDSLPDGPQLRWSLALLLLRQERYAEGWQAYEVRTVPAHADVNVTPPPESGDFSLPPRWHGEPLDGRSLLVWSEQGHGDELQFVRYLFQLRSTKGISNVTLCCKPALRSLFEAQGLADRVLSLDEWDTATNKEHDVWCYLMSLPALLGDPFQTLPCKLPYLAADPTRVAYWTGRLPPQGFRVGLVWNGSPSHPQDASRSLPSPTVLSPLLTIPGLKLVGLQKDLAEADMAGLPEQPWIRLGKDFADFADTSAVISQLDLVITVDTAVAHLAGALGIRCWIMVSRHRSDWRWLEGRDDSPWYPGVARIFRQDNPGDWGDVVNRLTTALRELVRHKSERRDRYNASIDPVASLIAQAVDLYKRGRFAEALAAADRGLAIAPDHAGLHNNRGIFAFRLGDQKIAESAYRRAIEVRPDYAEAWNNLGNLLAAQGRTDAAEEAYRAAIGARPDYPNALNSLAHLLLERGRPEEVEPLLKAALHLVPDDVTALVNLSVAYLRSWREIEAAELCHRALALDPANVPALTNLGAALAEARCFKEAERAFRSALESSPDDRNTNNSLAELLLMQGRFAEGWIHFEARLVAVLGNPDFVLNSAADGYRPLPLWRGEPLAGKSLLIWPEGGFGDQLQFIRFLPFLRNMGLRHLSLACSPALKPLFEPQALADRILAIDEWTPDMAEHHDTWCPMLSLPLRLQTTLETLPAPLPYLVANPVRRERWQTRIAQASLRVGLVWKGNIEHPRDAVRSLPSLSVLAPLGTMSGICFVSLQKCAGEDEAASPPSGLALANLGADIQDFADTAAIISLLDLVITVDTAAAHLAAAMGKPVWILLARKGTDWRWLTKRNDSPWYPGVVRLFRQDCAEDWTDVVARVAVALRERMDIQPE
jgi:Flp pilus assembly protein TadD